MSTATAPTAEGAAEGQQAPAGGGKKTIIIGGVAGLVLGAVVGALAIGPRLSPKAPPAHEADAAEAGGGEHGAGGEGGAAAAVHSVENLVVNPANTNGARFLLVTISIVGRDEVAMEEIKGRDAEVRDRIVDFLAAKSVDELSDPARREALRTDLGAAIGSLFKEGVVKRILLPQFVIQ